MKATLGQAAAEATAALNRLAAVLPPTDPLVDLIEREMQLHFAGELDDGQLRVAAEAIAHRVRARPAEFV